jgi:hypothetical protein
MNIRSEMISRIASLSEEIRNYPTPIARCDEQLIALIDERSALLALLHKNENPEPACSPDAIWVNDGGCHAA